MAAATNVATRVSARLLTRAASRPVLPAADRDGCGPMISSSCGCPATLTSLLNRTSTSTLSPRWYTWPLRGCETTAARVGAVRAVRPPSTWWPAAVDAAARLRFAGLPAASWIEPPFRLRPSVATPTPFGAWSCSCTE